MTQRGGATLKLTEWCAAIVFCCLPIFYFIAFGRYAFNEYDDGFLLSLVWRMKEGEVPYRDFYYVRPPGSLILHYLYALLLPDRWFIAGSRLALMVQLSVISYAAMAMMRRARFFKPGPVYFWSLCSLSFFLAKKGFSSSGWHTIDGVMFATLGLLALSSRKHFLGAALLLGAALCKQSFYPLLLLYSALVALREGRIPALKVVGIQVGAVVIGGLGLAAMGLLGHYNKNLSGVGEVQDLLASGLWIYVYLTDEMWRVIALFAGSWYLLRRRKRLRGGLIIGLLSVFFALMFTVYFGTDLNFDLGFRYKKLDQFLFLICAYIACAYLVTEDKEDRGGALLLISLAIVSWCAGLSWGYQTPHLGFAFVAAIFGREVEAFGAKKWLAYTLVVPLAMIWSGVLNQQKSGSAPLHATYRDASEVFPRLAFMEVDVEGYEKLRG